MGVAKHTFNKCVLKISVVLFYRLCNTGLISIQLSSCLPLIPWFRLRHFFIFSGYFNSFLLIKSIIAKVPYYYHSLFTLNGIGPIQIH